MSTSTIKAIDTKYNGHLFRSRLEARWAVYFDKLNIKYLYEDEGYLLSDGQKYLPDFHIKNTKIFIEIKPDNYNWEDDLKHDLFSEDMDCFVIVHAGLPGQERSKVFFGKSYIGKFPYPRVDGVSMVWLCPLFMDWPVIKKIMEGYDWEFPPKVAIALTYAIESASKARFEFNR